MSQIWHDLMTQLVSNKAQARKFSHDAKMRSGTRGPEVVRSNMPAVSRAWHRDSIIAAYRKADDARDYPGATDGQWHYDERRWRSKSQRHRQVQRTGVDACTTERQRSRSTSRRFRASAGSPCSAALVRTSQQGARIEALLTLPEAVS